MASSNVFQKGGMGYAWIRQNRSHRDGTYDRGRQGQVQPWEGRHCLGRFTWRALEGPWTRLSPCLQGYRDAGPESGLLGRDETGGDDVTFLRNKASALKQELSAIERRVQELETQGKEA